jgi:hypothetical protein
MDTSGRVGFGNVSVTYVFSCIAEDDPEYKRPDLRQDPSVVIEDRRQ